MVLSGRLRRIYDMIPPCDILSDIGTDHALLPAYALLNGRCKRVIACDVRIGPLERAERTLKKFDLQERMELRLGSGLQPILEEEADCIIIAGMGGILITELLFDSSRIAQQANCILLQPMTNQELVRPFLWQNGFEVFDESLVREGRKIYQVLRIRYTGVIRRSWDVIHEVIGEHLIRKSDPHLTDWIKDRTRKQEKIVQGLLIAKMPVETLEKESILLEKLKRLLLIQSKMGE